MRKILCLAVIQILLASGAWAQRAPLPWPKVQFLDKNGHPLAGGRVWTYVTGTTTPLATYTDANGIGANTNPVILDSAGRANIWITGRCYKIILEDSSCSYRDVYGTCHGVQQWTVDNLCDWGLMAAAGTVSIAGDVTGTTTASVVSAIQGVDVSATAPTDGQVLVYSSSAEEWQPGAGGGAVSGHTMLSATHTDTTATAAARGALIVGDATPKFTLLPPGASGTFLRSNGTDVSYSGVALATDVSGTLPVANGGTGLTSGTSGGLPYFSAVGVLASSAALAQNRIVLGGGAGAAPSTPLGLGSAGQVLLANPAGAPTWGSVPVSPLAPGSSLTVAFTNEGATGTVADKLVKLTGDPPTAVRIGTSDTLGIFGICVSGCTTTGTATIAVLGQANCIFDNATTALDYVVASTSVAGDCSDAGSAYPVGVQVLGQVLSTGVAGSHAVNFFLSDVASASGAGGGKGTTVRVSGSNLSSTVGNFSNTTPAAGANYLNVSWQKDTNASATNISARVPISGTGSNVASTSGSLTSGQHVCWDASGNAVNCGAGTSTTVLHGNAAGVPAYSAVTESDLSLSNVTTGDVSITAHGFAPIAPNVATQYLDGTGTWSTPSGVVPGAHDILGASHGDTLTGSVVAGDIIFGNATPKWARLAKGSDGQILTLSSGLPSWSSTVAAQTVFTKGAVTTPGAALTVAGDGSIATNAALSTHFRVTLTTDCPCTLSNPTNPVDGMKVVWEIIQAAGGSETLALDTKFAFGTDITSITITSTADKRDFLGAFYNSTADKWFVTSFAKGY